MRGIQLLVIDVYGKIEKIKISDKLKIYISNVPTDWKNGLVEDMLKEIRLQPMIIDEQMRAYGQSFQPEYSLSYLQEIVHVNIEDYSKYNLETIENCVQCLANNMVCLFFDYDYIDMPFFDWTTNCFDGRFCEEDYAEKVIYFSNFVNEKIEDGIHMNCIYTSNMDNREETRIISNLSLRLKSEFKGWKTQNQYIGDLKSMGKSIDSMIESENDYYKLDYIMNGIYKDNSYNHNHYLKTFSLLELLLLKPKQETNQLDALLVPYLDRIYGSDSLDVATLLRQMRNKIGHGDFKGFNGKAEKFAQKYMKDYNFDYSEYSRLNWILLHTCCLLDDLLRTALFRQIKVSSKKIKEI